MKKRYAIIFGGGGQDGRYMKLLLERERIHALCLTRQACDVGDGKYVEDVIRSVMPEYIFHFAAVSATHHDHLKANQTAIVDGTIHILESVKKHCPTCRVFLSGSILQFDDKDPIDHLSSFYRFDSAYAAQRHASVAIGRYYRTLDIPVYIGYFGHHDSPFRSEKHLAMRIAQAAKRIAAGSKEVIILKDPMDRKEWNFAGDFMEAVWMLVNSTIYEAVIGTGKTITVASFAELCLKEAGYEGDPCWTPDWTKIVPRITVTNPKIMATMGWEPKHSISDLAKMMVA